MSPSAPAPQGVDVSDAVRTVKQPKKRQDAEGRRILSDLERDLPKGKVAVGLIHAFLLVGTLIVGLGPLLWLMKSALTPTQDTLREPMALFPNGITFEPLIEAWTTQHISIYFVNTVIMAFGSWVVQMIVCTTGAYALAILRPKWGKIVEWMVLGTLFIPSVVLLVPLYLTVLKLPIVEISLLNTWWGVWLPSGASAFNMLLVLNFFKTIPKELFEAARIDGASTLRVFVSIVLPLSKPILGVLTVFSIIYSWKDFLWPMLVLPDPAKQPLSVRLAALEGNMPLETLLAAMAISTVIPIVLFLLFQRLFLNGASLSGSVKG